MISIVLEICFLLHTTNTYSPRIKKKQQSYYFSSSLLILSEH